jgi:hypothetical protein
LSIVPMRAVGERRVITAVSTSPASPMAGSTAPRLRVDLLDLAPIR